MKIQKNVAVFAGQEPQSRKAQEEQKGQQDRKTVFAGSLQKDTTRNLIEQKRQEAQQKALKIVSDVWEGDKTIEADLQSRRERIEAVKQENKALRSNVTELREQQADLQKNCGVSEDSQEQQDLELLRKVQNGDFTKEEYERSLEIREAGLTDYQEHQLSIDESIKDYEKTIEKNNGIIYSENAAIRSISQERLKYAPMVAAQKQADEIKDAASDEIIGMVVEDAKEHIDEEQEKKEEQAEKIKEEKEVQEELLEKRKEEAQEREELIEDIPMDEILTISKNKTDLQKEIQEIVDKMKLVAEDIKGTVVDSEI